MNTNEPIAYHDLHNIMTSLFSTMVQHQQQAVVEANKNRNRQRLAELARGQEEAEARAAEAEAALREVQAAAQETEQAREVQRREIEGMRERLVESYVKNGMTEADARKAAAGP